MTDTQGRARVTLADVRALIEMVQRWPMTPGEAIWLEGLIAQLGAALPPPDPAADPGPRKVPRPD